MAEFRAGLRLQVLAGVILLALGVLVARLWWVQVARGEEYTARIRGASQVTVRIPSVRGEIRDRNGLTLVDNRPTYDVDFYLPDMVRGYRDRTGDVPMNRYTKIIDGFPKQETEWDIVKVVNEAVIPRLQQLSLATGYNSTRLRTHYRNEREVPFTYMEDLDFQTMARFSEHNVGLPGVDVAIKPVRRYAFGALAAHLVGYVGDPVDISSEPDVGKYNFYQADVGGKASIELFMDDYLRGKPGVRVMQKNSKGVIEGQVALDPPVPGDDVYLTIDARIQSIAENALRAGGVGRGAAVVIDPSNGDILAMASVPSYDPNTFIPSIKSEKWNDLINDKTNPLLNRAISGYAPGSTYKLAIALAGLSKGLSPETYFNCSGGVTYGNKFMRCWIHEKGGAHGSLNLSGGIKNSCNAYFFQFGNAAGLDTIVEVGRILGLGEGSGLPVTGESPGILPSREYLVRRNIRPSAGIVANVSIGQGDVLASPLQMAMMGATVANGGESYFPRLIDKIVANDGTVTLRDPPKLRGNLRDKLSEGKVEAVRRGMWRVVNEDGGTASRARLKDVEVAGKTGTAQNWRDGEKDNHAWFLCFAPYENPKYAICVFVQGAKSGGQVAAPVAAKILEESFAMQDGEHPQVVALAPAAGSFKFISQIDFGRDIPAAYGADEETSESAPRDSVAAQERVVSAAPNIKPEADEQGRLIPRAKPATSADKKKKPNLFERLFKKRP